MSKSDSHEDEGTPIIIPNPSFQEEHGVESDIIESGEDEGEKFVIPKEATVILGRLKNWLERALRREGVVIDRAKLKKGNSERFYVFVSGKEVLKIYLPDGVILLLYLGGNADLISVNIHMSSGRSCNYYTLPVSDSWYIYVGRSDDSYIYIPSAEGVSRRHCTISGGKPELSNGFGMPISIKDRRSTNGTTVEFLTDMPKKFK